ncbi:hypothetical protein BDV06DRAFT_229064 [Aspergillus oleicola]
MSARSADSHSPSAQQPRRHIGKACEGCRQQKIKCNGELPCERCARLSLLCTVRSVARQRRRQTQHKAPEHDADVVQKALRPDASDSNAADSGQRDGSLDRRGKSQPLYL